MDIVLTPLQERDKEKFIKKIQIAFKKAVVEQFGVTAVHLLKQRLLEAIKNDLLFEGRSVSQLAEAYGFSDPSHLMRFFKQQTGRTCSAFLEDYRYGVGE